MLHYAKTFSILLTLCISTQFTVGDNSVRFDWVNATILQATTGADIVRNETKMNIVVCYFDDKDRKFVFCNPNPVQLDSSISLINPFNPGNARNLSYGIWLQSPTSVWEDKIFGIPLSPRNATSFVDITEYSIIGDSQYNMKIRPISNDFPQMTIKSYVTCENGSKYYADEMDLTEYIDSNTTADDTAPMPSGLSSSCSEGCAEIYIRATERNSQQQHSFRVGVVCPPLRKRNEVLVMAAVKIRTAINDLLHTVIPQPTNAAQ